MHAEKVHWDLYNTKSGTKHWQLCWKSALGSV